MSFVSECRGRCEDERPYKGIGVNKTPYKHPFRISSRHFLSRSTYGNREKTFAIAHTRNDRKDEGEAEEEERMVMKLFPIESAQTTVIGAGSEPVGLKCRHPGFQILKERSKLQGQ